MAWPGSWTEKHIILHDEVNSLEAAWNEASDMIGLRETADSDELEQEVKDLGVAIGHFEIRVQT
jgi:hypothetical protein